MGREVKCSDFNLARILGEDSMSTLAAANPRCAGAAGLLSAASPAGRPALPWAVGRSARVRASAGALAAVAQLPPWPAARLSPRRAISTNPPHQCHHHRHTHPPPRAARSWLAPEVLTGASPSLASDVFSLGVVLWELLTLEAPYANEPNTWQVSNCAAPGTAAPRCCSVFRNLWRPLSHHVSFLACPLHTPLSPCILRTAAPPLPSPPPPIPLRLSALRWCAWCRGAAAWRSLPR